MAPAKHHCSRPTNSRFSVRMKWVQVLVTLMAVYYFGYSHIHLRTELHWDNHHDSGHFSTFHQNILDHYHGNHEEGQDHGHMPHHGEDHLIKWLPRTQSSAFPGIPFPIVAFLWTPSGDELRPDFHLTIPTLKPDSPLSETFPVPSQPRAPPFV